MTLIIGASGRARHGKTISCEAICKHAYQRYGAEAKVYDIGGYVRAFGIEHGLLPDIPREQMTPPLLDIMVQIGSSQRAADENFWVRPMMAAIAADQPDVACIPNLRFEQEAKAIKAAGGYVVRFTRLNKDGSVFISRDRNPNDVTETALEFWPADFYLTSVEGQDDFMIAQAITLYEYLRGIRL